MVDDAGHRFARCLLLLCVLVAAPTSVEAQQDEGPTAAFAAAERAFAGGDYRQALEQFEAAREAGETGPALEFNIGVCHYKLAEYAAAAGAFREVAERYPAMRGLATYNLGLALLKQQRDAAARRAFALAREAGDPKIAALAEQQLERLGGGAAQATRRGWALLDLGLGHDDNVALIDTSLLTAESTASAFNEIFAIGSQPLATSPWTLDGSAYLVRYPQAAAFDQTAIELGASYVWSWRGWRARVEPRYGRTTLGGKGFEGRLAAALELERSFAALRLDLSVSHERIDELDAAFAFVAGTRDRIGARLGHQGPRASFWVGYEHERNDRDGANVSPDRDRIRARYRYRWTDVWAFEAQLLQRTSRYDALATPRRETLDEISVAALRRLPRGWRLETRYGRSHNDSSDPAYAYRRGRIVVVFDKGF